MSSLTTTRHDRALRAAALAFAGATGYNSVVAIRQHVPGEPLRIRIPLQVSTGILIGWGSAIAAPWPMPVLGLIAARRALRETTIRPALACAGIGIAGIVGILIEPNTYNPKTWTPAIRRAIAAHVATSATLTWTGIRHLKHSHNNRAT
jgi:hypothetical protein